MTNWRQQIHSRNGVSPLALDDRANLRQTHLQVPGVLGNQSVLFHCQGFSLRQLTGIPKALAQLSSIKVSSLLAFLASRQSFRAKA